MCRIVFKTIYFLGLSRYRYREAFQNYGRTKHHRLQSSRKQHVFARIQIRFDYRDSNDFLSRLRRSLKSY